MKKVLDAAISLLTLATAGVLVLLVGWWLVSGVGGWVFGDQCNRQQDLLRTARRNGAKPSTIEHQYQRTVEACK